MSDSIEDFFNEILIQIYFFLLWPIEFNQATKDSFSCNIRTGGLNNSRIFKHQSSILLLFPSFPNLGSLFPEQSLFLLWSVESCVTSLKLTLIYEFNGLFYSCIFLNDQMTSSGWLLNSLLLGCTHAENAPRPPLAHCVNGGKSDSYQTHFLHNVLFSDLCVTASC